MATVSNNILVEGLRGKFGEFLVFRNLRGKTFISPPARKPNKKKESESQRNTRSNFREATEWAQRILRDAEMKSYYKQRAKVLKLPNAYTAAITDYMRKPKVIKLLDRNTITYSISKRGFTLQDVKAELTDAEGLERKIVVRQHNDTWLVHYTPDSSRLSSLILVIRDSTLREMKFTDVPI